MRINRPWPSRLFAVELDVRPRRDDVDDARGRFVLAEDQAAVRADRGSRGGRRAGRAGRLRRAPRASLRAPRRVRARHVATRRRSLRARCARRSAHRRGPRRARGRAGGPRLARSAGRPRARSGRVPPRGQSAGPASPAAIASRIAAPRRRMPEGWIPRICSSAWRFDGWRLASSTSAGSASTDPTGRSSVDAVRSRQAASSLADGPGSGIELPDPGQPLPGGVGIALVGGSLEAPALLVGPLLAAALAQAPAELIGERQQVDHVLGCVAELLARQRPGIPAACSWRSSRRGGRGSRRSGFRIRTARSRRRSRRRSGCRRCG